MGRHVVGEGPVSGCAAAAVTGAARRSPALHSVGPVREQWCGMGRSRTAADHATSDRGRTRLGPPARTTSSRSVASCRATEPPVHSRARLPAPGARRERLSSSASCGGAEVRQPHATTAAQRSVGQQDGRPPVRRPVSSTTRGAGAASQDRRPVDEHVRLDARGRGSRGIVFTPAKNNPTVPPGGREGPAVASRDRRGGARSTVAALRPPSADVPRGTRAGRMTTLSIAAVFHVKQLHIPPQRSGGSGRLSPPAGP